jgi:hypothetical protein
MSENELATVIARKRAEALEAAGEEPPQEETPAPPPPPEPPDPEDEAPPAEEEAPAEEEPEVEEEVDEEGERTVAQAIADAVEDLPEDATAEERQEAEDRAVEDFYAGRYKTREEAERGIAEKDDTIQRLHRERAELRQQLEAAAAEQAAVPLDTRAWQEWAEEQVESGAGQQGALEALREGGYEGYQIYLKAWLEDDEGRADAVLFNNAMMMEIAQRAPAPEPERTPQEEAVAARALALQRRPDLVEYEDDMAAVVDQLAPETREWLKEEAQSGVEGKARALEYLYLEARAGRAPRREAAQKRENARRRSSATAAKVDATVTSSEATPVRTPLSEAEQEALRVKNERRVAWGQEPLPEE